MFHASIIELGLAVDRYGHFDGQFTLVAIYRRCPIVAFVVSCQINSKMFLRVFADTYLFHETQASAPDYSKSEQ